MLNPSISVPVKFSERDNCYVAFCGACRSTVTRIGLEHVRAGYTVPSSVSHGCTAVPERKAEQ